MRKILITICFLSTLVVKTKAQVDPHLSQYYVNPAWLNPALTGAFDGNLRVSGIYRNQWGQIANGFETSGFSADIKSEKNMNFGVNILKLTAGAGYSYLSTNFSASYSGVRFDDAGYKRLVFGLQMGMMNRKFDASMFQFGSQWNPINGYNPSSASNETFANVTSSVLDISTGAVYYDADPNKMANVFVGFSFAHLTEPKSSFGSQSLEQKLPLRYTIHGGLRLTFSDFISVVPNFVYLKQGNATEKMLGAYAQMSGPSGVDLLLGANYRLKDAIVPYLGLSFKSLVLGYSYDLNNSELSKSVGNVGSSEISLSYVFKKSKTLGEKNFICPRL